MWSPVVMTETPARSRSIVILPVIPRPPAAFSPFTTTKSIACFAFNSGSRAMTALRPGSPTMSPRKSTVSIEHDRIEQVQNVDAISSFARSLDFFAVVDVFRFCDRGRQPRGSGEQTEMGRARTLSAHDYPRRIRALTQRRLLHARNSQRSYQDRR